MKLMMMKWTRQSVMPSENVGRAEKRETKLKMKAVNVSHCASWTNALYSVVELRLGVVAVTPERVHVDDHGPLAREGAIARRAVERDALMYEQVDAASLVLHEDGLALGPWPGQPREGAQIAHMGTRSAECRGRHRGGG